MDLDVVYGRQLHGHHAISCARAFACCDIPKAMNDALHVFVNKMFGTIVRIGSSEEVRYLFSVCF